MQTLLAKEEHGKGKKVSPPQVKSPARRLPEAD